MIADRWWNRYPQVLAAEQASLQELGIAWSRDEAVFDAGVMRINLPQVNVADDAIDLVVTYPDLYPYFRFEIDAPKLNLPYHQNPFFKNLCLLGRNTRNWHIGDSIGSLIKHQLPKVVRAGRMTDAAEAQDIEEHQAEPFTEYYGYLQGSIILIEQSIELNGSHNDGSCWIGIREPVGKPPNQPLRGALVKVECNGSRKVFEPSRQVIELYSKAKLKAIWKRLKEPPHVEGLEFMKFLRGQDNRFLHLPRNDVEGGHLCVAAAVFPVEHTWRAGHSDGWVFACEFIPNDKSLALNVRPGL